MYDTMCLLLFCCGFYFTWNFNWSINKQRKEDTHPLPLHWQTLLNIEWELRRTWPVTWKKLLCHLKFALCWWGNAGSLRHRMNLSSAPHISPWDPVQVGIWPIGSIWKKKKDVTISWIKMDWPATLSSKCSFTVFVQRSASRHAAWGP